MESLISYAPMLFTPVGTKTMIALYMITTVNDSMRNSLVSMLASGLSKSITGIAGYSASLMFNMVMSRIYDR